MVQSALLCFSQEMHKILDDCRGAHLLKLSLAIIGSSLWLMLCLVLCKCCVVRWSSVAHVICVVIIFVWGTLGPMTKDPHNTSCALTQHFVCLEVQ